MNQPKRLIVATLFLCLAGGLLFFGGRLAVFALTPAKSGTPDSLVVEIRKGQSPTEITRVLYSQGIISDDSSFSYLGRIMRQWRKIKAGEYKVSASMSPMQIFATITSGISMAHPLTVREGENMYEIASDLEAKRLVPAKTFLTLSRNPAFIATLGFKSDPPPSLEGYLFPDTYFFNRTMTAEDMIRQMVRRFLVVWTDSEEARAKALGLTRHQAITLASIVEKETGAQQERPLISSVFHNRLKKRMRLQSDPTTIYGIWDRYKGNLQRSDLLSPSPYNTYTLPALPVGPISNPGKAAIHAALFPVESPYLFFVSQNDGTHQFSRTLDEHVKAVRQFQLDPNARKGKSWRDLNTKQTAAGAPSASALSQ